MYIIARDRKDMRGMETRTFLKHKNSNSTVYTSTVRDAMRFKNEKHVKEIVGTLDSTHKILEV